MTKNNKIIVLIEDDHVLGATLNEFLSLHFTHVLWFKNASDGLGYFRTNFCDLIVSDLMMPSMSGGQLYSKLRKHVTTHSIPFIIITAHVDEQAKLDYLALGINDYILKPFDLKELLYKMTNLLEYKANLMKQYVPDPFSKVTIKLSSKNFLTILNEQLLRDINEKVDYEVLASALHVSKSTLDKKIRKYTLKNSSQYIREFKLEYALRLMQAGETNIEYISQQAGFRSLSYFSTSFKNYTGMKPTAYLKKNTSP